MAAATTDEVTIKDNKPNDPDKAMRGKMICQAFDEIGGIPAHFFKSTATRVSPKSWRVNIWTAKDSDSFVKDCKIEHSLFLTEK